MKSLNPFYLKVKAIGDESDEVSNCPKRLGQFDLNNKEFAHRQR